MRLRTRLMVAAIASRKERQEQMELRPALGCLTKQPQD
jgi:hypothetical protein